MNDPKGRKWQITINNPLEHGFDHERIRTALDNLKSTLYWCMADEQGAEEHTPHTHIYAQFTSPVRFSTLKNAFPPAHLERAYGTAQVNRDYIAKTGKWENSEKAETSINGSFEEWGEMPIEQQGGFSVEAIIIERILDGATNAEILREFPDYLRGMRDVENVRQMLKAEEYRNKWRTLETTYIYGTTGLGKTRHVMEGYGYSNVYAVNNYKHPFDLYANENVMLFDEFDSKIRIQDINNYLDGYPISLPARYNNKQACYERVYIISNLPLTEQYKHEQSMYPTIWEAFLRRIHKVLHFMPNGTRREYLTADYINGANNWVELPANTPVPFNKNNEGSVAKNAKE
ncbi:MAG: replication protein [Defluviitaleaceae bacterium]|nr:replication protein [Defluviitaleaceae bacterium]